MGKSGSKMESFETASDLDLDISCLEGIPAKLKEEIERHFTQQTSYIEQLKNKYERLTINTGKTKV